ncbi:S41 family peptidase [Flavihumibacter rivuli]|uniref:S41 family peptidase n=1 Tax=Flavihumibacter rivuli TaxID=2838156 RepID=UPI001BDEA83A|nr:S41 family peptidase [Flavihumibacter rivuli]ULQ56861.1 S41 family peptidase [Flavihumibacter rivuli]
MSRYLLILATCLFIGSLSVSAQVPDSVKTFVDSALNLMEQRSIYSANVNWAEMRSNVYKEIAGSKSYQDAYPSLIKAFNALGDKHGWLVFEDKDYRNPDYHFDTTRINPDIKAAAAKGPKVYAGLIDNHYAYVSIPFFGGQSAEAMQGFAQKIQDSLCANIKPNTKGVIVDLRLNGGGNMFPMISGLGNLLGDGIISMTRNNKGDTTGKTMVKGNSVIAFDTTLTSCNRKCGDLSRLPVAVIIGPVTGSSGEALALAFKGRPAAVLVGEPTAGFVTANQGWYLPGKDNGIVLAVDFMTDRTGKQYMEDVQPDIRVVGGDNFFNWKKDGKIKAAIDWMKKSR